MEANLIAGIVAATVAGSLPLVLTHLLARGDRQATAEQRFQASIAAALTHCQEELSEAQKLTDEFREKYFTERALRVLAGAGAAEVKLPPPAGG